MHPHAPPGDRARQERLGSNNLSNSGAGPRVSELAGAPPDALQAADLTLAHHNRVLT